MELIYILLVLTVPLVMLKVPVSLVDLIPFIRVKKAFSHAESSRPDYNSEESWFVKEVSLSENDDRLCDVFFVHRTTFLSGKEWNSRIDNKSMNRRTFKYAVEVQCRTFEGFSRVFAPTYRQATLYSFYDKGRNGDLALDLAYEDVKTAFIYYLNNYNGGRPFLLAGHSQGTAHLIRLIREVIDIDPSLYKRLICAYLAAMPVKKNLFQNIHVANGADDINCYVSWSTFGKGASPLYFKGEYDDALCTNPLSWKSNESEPVHANRKTSAYSYFFQRKIRVRLSVSVNNGVLHVGGISWKFPSLRYRDYVMCDYHIFFDFIRKNCLLRLQTMPNKKNK